MPEPRLALVVDDNQTNRILARALLGKLGWTVEDVESGEAGIAKIQSGTPYQLILLDISMPGLSGEETCARIRTLPEGRGLRIIAYTAHAFPEERSRILAAGFDDILIKPINAQALAAVASA